MKGGSRSDPEKGQFCFPSLILTVMDPIMKQIGPDGGGGEWGWKERNFKNFTSILCATSQLPLLIEMEPSHEIKEDLEKKKKRFEATQPFCFVQSLLYCIAV